MLDPGEFPGNVAQLSLSISFLPASQAAWSIFLANPSGKIVTDLFESSRKCSMVQVKSVRRLRENTIHISPLKSGIKVHIWLYLSFFFKHVSILYSALLYPLYPDRSIDSLGEGVPTSL